MHAVHTELQQQCPPPARALRIAAINARDMRSFALHASPFLVTLLTYEGFRAVTGLRGEIHVGDLYALEEQLFPVHTAQGVQAVSEVIAQATHPVLDAVCGGIYLLFLAQYLAVATYLFGQDRPRMLRASVGFLVANLLGWTIWLVYPAAPPWYVDQYGMGPALLHAPAGAGGMVRFDELIGLPIATTFYAQSQNIFGAMPSLHVTYAVLIALLVWSLQGWLRIGTILFAVALSFSALYMRHHYLLDVIAGAALAVLVWYLVTVLPRWVRAWRQA